eukprot:gene33765-56435_t
MESLMVGFNALSNPLEVAKAGERIYAENYQQEYEAKFSGQFAVIEVKSGEVFQGKFPEDAIGKAREKFPDGMLHLIRIGSSVLMSVWNGHFDSKGNPCISIEVFGTNSSPLALDATIDTGFSGFLMMPMLPAMPLGM